jgi:hypothetical protein
MTLAGLTMERMPTIVRFLLSVVLVLVGLTVAVSALVVFLAVLGLWSLRALWGRLTGRPVTGFTARFGPRDVFEEVLRRGRARPASPTPRAAGRGRLADVTDVEAREPGA